ncbi:hypothetical protein GW17_00039479 [Ensete ventricosum]|nr:hypothetical protein GW17_00039479 [Ensete ventricosum]
MRCRRSRAIVARGPPARRSPALFLPRGEKDRGDSIHCLNTFTGHTSHVTSLDFHPKEMDILCSCDDNGEIRYWSCDKHMCKRVSKVGSNASL